MPSFKFNNIYDFFIYVSKLEKPSPPISPDYLFFFNIALQPNLSYRDILNLCSSNPELNKICNDDYFWAKRAELDFNFNLENFLSTKDLSGREKYKMLMNPDIEKYIEDRNYNAVKFLLKDYNIIESLVEKSKFITIDKAFKYALDFSSVEIIKLFLETPGFNPIITRKMVLNLYQNEDKKIVKLLLETPNLRLDFEDFTDMVIAYDKPKMVDDLLEDPRINLIKFTEDVVTYGRTEIFKHIIEYGFDPIPYISDYFQTAGTLGNDEIMKYLLRYKEFISDENIKYVIEKAQRKINSGIYSRNQVEKFRNIILYLQEN